MLTLRTTTGITYNETIRLCNATVGHAMDATFVVGPLFKGDIYGVVALVLSLVNNVIATSLVGLVAWCV